jgi:asparagine synthase (glutamine-hydrolysing)
MEPYLPHDVIYREKAGFPVPVSDWFKDGLYRLATDMLLDPKSAVSGFVDLTSLRTMLKQHRAGVQDFSNELWGLLVLEYWFQAFEVRL